MVQNK